MLLATLAAFAGVTIHAQDASDEVFELSPFEVDASQDTGYRANSTLAGSRLNTQLKDVAASVTVLTSEFMEDLGANDIEAALAYVASAETGQTFEGGTTTAYIQGEQGSSPSRNRIRGLAQADVTADFFGVTNPHLDNYNVERVSVVRGPNSVLFGLGSPSGIINYITKKASLGKNFGQYRFEVDNFGTIRNTLDVNHVLVEDKLAVRVMGLHDDARYQIDSAFDRDKRVTLAATYKLSENTTLRLNTEEIDIKSRRPRFIPPTDNITRWVDGGSPTHDAFANPGVNPGPFFDELVGGGQLPAQFYTDLDTPGPDYWIRLENKLPNGSRLPTGERVMFYRSSNPDQGTNFFLDPLVHDPRVFPIEDIDIAALPGNWATRKNSAKNVFLNHRFTDNFNVEIGYHTDVTQDDRLTQVIGQSNSIQIDPNETLPNGEVNPNFLRPFIFGRGVGRFTEQENEALRVQVSYELDFNDISDNSWLGLHRLSALYSDDTYESFTYAWEQRISTVNHSAYTEDELLNDSDRRSHAIYYVGDPVSPGQLHPNYTGFPTRSLVETGRAYPMEFFDGEQWTTGEGPVALERMVHRNAGWNIRDAEGIGVALQSFFLNGKVVTTFGWRDDDVEGLSTSFPTPGADGLYSLERSNWSFDNPPLITGDSTTTKGIVVHPTDWLSFHYNESENFVVSAPKVDILGRPIPASSGVGEDYGFSFNLLQDAMNVKVNWFNTVQKDSEDGGLGFVGFWRMRGFERGIYSRINNGTITGVDWINWDGTMENYDRFPNVSDVRDFEAKGMEIEVTYNPNANWRIAFNAAKQETKQQNTGAAMLEYIDLRQPFWDQFWDQEWNNSRTVGEQFTSAVGSRLFPALAADGRTSIDQAKWSANMVTNYRFTEGRFNGFAAGGSLRWSDKRALGYALTSDADGNVITDLDRPFMGPDNLNVGLHASFRKMILNDSVDWKIQLNIQNFIGDPGLVPVRINPDGNTAGFRIGRERIFKLSNTFKF